MTSHIHLLLTSDGKVSPDNIIRDMKSFISQSFHKMLLDGNNNYESRKNWLLWIMERSGDKKGGNRQYRFWQDGSHTVEIWSDKVFYEKLEYIHMNPVVSGFVSKPEDWLYSSARNYANLPSVLDIHFDR